MASGYSTGQVSSFQSVRVRRRVDRARDELVPGVREGAAGDATAPSSAFSRKSERETCQPPRLPAAAQRQVWVQRRVPAEATSSATSSITAAVDARLALGEVEGVVGVELLERPLEGLERPGSLRPLLLQELLPVPPAPHELAVVEARSGSGGSRSRAGSPPRSRARARASGRRGSRCSTAACRARSASPRSPCPP